MTQWNPEGFKPTSEFKNILAIEGDLVDISDGVYEPNEMSKVPKNYTQITIENVDNIEMKGEAEPPKFPDGVHRWRFNESDKENSLNHAFVVAASKLVKDLPDGLYGKRMRFEKCVVREPKGKQEEWSILVPVSILVNYKADIGDTVRTLLESTNDVKAFKRAALMNSQINSSPFMAKIQDNTIFAEFGYTTEGNAYTKA